MLASGLFLFLFRKFNSSNIFVIVNYDIARSLNLTRLKRALGAERSPVKSFYVLYYCQALVQVQVRAPVPTGPQVE